MNPALKWWSELEHRERTDMMRSWDEDVLAEFESRVEHLVRAGISRLESERKAFEELLLRRYPYPAAADAEKSPPRAEEGGNPARAGPSQATPSTVW